MQEQSDDAGELRPSYPNAIDVAEVVLASGERSREERDHPNNSFVWSRMAVVLGSAGLYRDAAAANERAVKLSPEDPYNWAAYGLTLCGIGRYSDVVNA